MVVLITNITDIPGKNPTQVDIYNKTLAPGSSFTIPADLVNQKLRAIEGQGLIAIGNLPPWYVTAKRHSKSLSKEEKQKRQVVPLPEPIPLRAERPEKKDREPIAKKG